jgi:ABC-type transport system involved in multi-copper enzyme maturation permease subunit
MIAVRQTYALLVDAIRRLRAAKLFWVALGLSLLVAAIFGVVGIDENGLNLLFYGDLPLDNFNTSLISAEAFYKILFLTFGVAVWLAWAANILALISTADLVPSLVADGSADLYLSRPLGRVRLFLTRYATGLLFVAAQAFCFALASIIVIRLRGGVWLPGLFWTVPMVTIFFSLLYSISSLVGLITGSSIASILLTLLVWFLCWAINVTDQALLQQREQAAVMVEMREESLAFNREQAEKFSTAGQVMQDAIEADREPLERAVADAEGSYRTWARAHRIVMWVKAPLPKTGETLQVLNNKLVSAADLEVFGSDFEESRQRAERRAERRGTDVDEELVRVEAFRLGQLRAEEAYKSRSLWWSLGTSLLFEAVLVSLAAFLFARRDL